MTERERIIEMKRILMHIGYSLFGIFIYSSIENM